MGPPRAGLFIGAHWINHQPIVFHASEIRAGRKLWRKVSPEKRQEVLDDLCEAITQSPARGRHLYAVAVEKSKQLYGEGAVERATEEICRRFDIFLQRQFHEHADAQRGLLIFSEGRFDARAKIWVRGFHQRGTSWGAINNFADIPYFASMRESRLLQAADLVSHSIWLMYERNDASLFRKIIPHFNTQAGTIHGLVHVRATTEQQCECPACYSR